jgi:hypothetical protein
VESVGCRQTPAVVTMDSFSQKLERVVQTLNEHGCIMAELLLAINDTVPMTRTDDDNDDGSGSSAPTTGRDTASAKAAETIGDVAVPRGNSLPPRPEDVPAQSAETTPRSGRREPSASSKCVPTSVYAHTAAKADPTNKLQISMLRRALGEIQQYADQADWRLGRLAKKLDRHDAEIDDLRSKIIWAQVECCHHRQSCPLHHHQPFSAPLHVPSSNRHRHHRCSGGATNVVPFPSPGHQTVSFGGGMSVSPGAVIQQKQPAMASAVVDQVIAIGAPQKLPLAVPDMTPGCGVDVTRATPEVAVVGGPTPSAYQQQPQQLLTTHGPATVSFRQQQTIAVDRPRSSRHQQHVMHLYQQQQQQQQHQQPMMMMVHGFGGTLYHQLQNNAQPQQQIVIACTSPPSYADTVRNRSTAENSGGGGGSTCNTGIGSKSAPAAEPGGLQENANPSVGISTSSSGGCALGVERRAADVLTVTDCRKQHQQTVGGLTNRAEAGSTVTSFDCSSSAGGPRCLKSSREHPHQVSGFPPEFTRCTSLRRKPKVIGPCKAVKSTTRGC